MKNFKINKLIQPVVFSVIIVGLSVLTFALPKKEYSENEKRYLAKFPEISTKAIASGEFQDGFEKYVSDHIFGRDLFVGINSYFSMIMGRNSVGEIYNCKDGYLINAPKDNGSENFEKNLKNFDSFTKSVGVESSIMIVPTAGYIMDKKLPLFHGKYNDDKLFSLAAELTPNIRFIDTRDVLINSEKMGKQIYYRTDHHLTSEGTYVLYSLFCDINSMRYPGRNDYEIKVTEGFKGTALAASGYALTKADSIEVWDRGLNVKVTTEDGTGKDEHDGMFFENHLESDDKYPVFLDGNHALTTIKNPGARGGKILLIKDSYAHCLAPFLAENYSEVHMVDMRYYRKSVSEYIKENGIDEILYIYGTDSLITDTNSGWLM